MNIDKKPPKGPNSGFGGWGPVFRQTLLEKLPKGSKILELGSGIGTRWLCKHWEVKSIENDPGWIGVAGKSLYFNAPIIDGWYSRRIVSAACKGGYDLLIIDGPIGTVGRKGMIKHLGLFDLSKPIIVDDTHRIWERELARQISKITGRKMTEYVDGTKEFIWV